MAIKLYGIPESRAARCLWMLEEVGVAYENVPVHFLSSAQQPDYLKINPNGRIPTLDDDGLVLFESLAINIHLARRYGIANGLWPNALEDQSRAIQWSFWGMSEVESAVVKMMLNRLFLPESKRDESVAVEGARAYQKSISVLAGALQGRQYLLGNEFTVADLNVYSLVDWRHPAMRTPYLDDSSPAEVEAVGAMNLAPHAADWAQRCGGRPALARVLAMRNPSRLV